ncbi:Speckle-type POZ protein [Araneus ventricosus]|uniref:Speckle-type POZ protein n=1 Tax=Araneus ventricosus TaxID=182803 RepID=A0A4Y2NRZ6_ARAVE|nr:Speckle-type POZ protein [Araneus ventricosus]
MCRLTREDQNIPGLAHYLVDSEITIDKNIWKQSESKCCFGNFETKYLPLMNVSDLRNENNFPAHCKLTVQLGFRRCILRRFCPKYFSATTELVITTGSFSNFLGNPYSSETHHAPVEEVSRDVVVEDEMTDNDSSNRDPPDIKMYYLYRIGHNCFKILLTTEWYSLFVKYEIRLFDVKRNIVISSKEAESLLLKSNDWVSDLLLPWDYTGEIKKSPSVFDASILHSSVSYHVVELQKDFELEFGTSFSSYGNQDLKADLKNFYHNRARRPDICLKGDDSTFQVHRCILAARSPVFKAVLENDTLESRTGLVKIAEISTEVLRLLLSFLYSSEVEEDLGYPNSALLYAAADKYGILSLLRICRRELKKNISVDNFDELLLMSHLHSDVKLKEFLTSFLSSWYPNSDAISHLDSMVLDRPLTEEDIEFLAEINAFFRLMSEKKGK